MSVYKEGNGWTAYIYYVDWQGNKKRKKKMGFATKREAKEYETQFLLSKSRDVNMKFNNFIEITLNYAHLYPSTQLDMVAQLDKLGRIE